MKRPIKFRARCIDTGEFLYGDIAQTEVGILMRGGFEVHPDSVAQLVGFDRDGNEVYEGDTLVLKNGTEYGATLFDNIISSAKLKEGEQ